MVKIGICLILIFTFQLHANDNLAITDLDELNRTNQRVLDVFKDTEFDYDKPIASPENEHNYSHQNDLNSSNNQTAQSFVLQHPRTIAKNLDYFMRQELLNSCSQTLLNDIHNTRYISGKPELKSERVYNDQMTRLLLVGPRGSGKSSLALAIAYTLDRPYLFLSAASLANEYKNSAVTIINSIFDPLIESEMPTVVIIDEITAFTKRFNAKNSDSDPGAVEHLWIKLDACKRNPGLLVIFTANSTDEIPDTIKDRLSASEFYIDHPDFYARKRILHAYLGHYFEFDLHYLDEIARKTEGFTLREMNMVIFRAKNNALHRNIRRDDSAAQLSLKKNDIESALKTLLTAHNAELSAKNKKYYKEVYDTVAPHIVPVISMLINIYLQVKFHEEQMAFSKQCHQDTLAFQKEAHEETMELSQWNADRQLYENKQATKKNMEFQKKTHKENMQHQRRVHWDNMAHAIETAECQQEFATKTHEEGKEISETRHVETIMIGEKHHQENTEIQEKQHIATTAMQEKHHQHQLKEGERHHKENQVQTNRNFIVGTTLTATTAAMTAICPPAGLAMAGAFGVIGYFWPSKKN